jgi:glycosyltransferase involved in cell wall biosynthesis
MLVESVRALVASGAAVTVALPGEGPLAPALRAVGAEVSVVPTVVLRKAFLSPRGLLSLAALCARTLPGMAHVLRRTGADVVLVNTVTIPLWPLLARVTGRRVVGHVHEAEEGVPRLLGLALDGPLLACERVLVNSRAAQRAVAAVLPRLAGRTGVVYNGVPGPAHPLAPPRQELAGTVRLVLVGRLAPRKGTDVAVAALAELVARGHDATLDLVGEVFPGYEWFEEQLRATASEHGIADRVRFRGFRSDPWDSLAEADVALVPSRAEPFGNVAVEAGLAGRPVVASAVQGLLEIVDDGRTGRLVPPDNPAALADAVEDLLRDWPSALRMAAAARDEAARRFSVERYGREVVDAVLGTSRPLEPTTA